MYKKNIINILTPNWERGRGEVKKQGNGNVYQKM
jgi:hypothetical protein